MLVFRMFATLHVQTAFPPPCLCDLGDLCVEIPSPFLTQCYSSSRTSKQAAQNKSLQITALRALSFSVSRKSFTCHSYENCRVWLNCSHYGTQLTPATNSIPCSITPVPFLFKVFHTLLHFFARTQNSAFLFSSNYALVTQNTGGGAGDR